MDIAVEGKQVLSGEITASGSKNSAVGLIPATILFKEKARFENVPDIVDVHIILKVMEKMGSRHEWDKEEKVLWIDNSDIALKNLSDKEISNLKGTSLFWGPMLSRFGNVHFKDLPGGCTLGLRPLDAHYLAFRDLGVKVSEGRDFVHMDARHAKAKTIWLYEMSPTATENAVMLSVSLKGKTKIVGAASEPQVQDLCEYLVKCGAKIEGIGSDVLTIEGGRDLYPKPHKMFCDHYEVTTFLALGAVTGGRVQINNGLVGRIENIVGIFSRFGLEIGFKNGFAVIEKGQKIDLDRFSKDKPLAIKARPWPGLPVDTIPLFIPLALAARKGQVLFHNWMYEAGLFWTSELLKLGANVFMGDPHRVLITAGNKLRGATLEAPYIIRAVVAMVMAAMIAEGKSKILDADALYRGHPNFAENLNKLGAKINIIKEISR